MVEGRVWRANVPVSLPFFFLLAGDGELDEAEAHRKWAL